MNWRNACFLLLLFVYATAEAAPRKKVLVIGIDGCRTDALLAADAPNLDALIADGAFCDDVRILGPRDTGSDTVSGPGWSSLMTGVWADKHGVLNNRFQGANYTEYPHFFRRLKDARPEAFTASIEDWGMIHKHIVSAADLNADLTSKEKDHAGDDKRVAALAVTTLAERNPEAMFVYFGNVDETGHRKGFHPRVPEYIQAIEDTDKHIGTLLTAMRGRKTAADEDWLVLVCTDHGGAGTDHSKGHTQPEVTTVFMIVSGPAAKRGKLAGPAYLVDVPATALTHLGVAIDPAWKWDGRAVGLK